MIQQRVAELEEGEGFAVHRQKYALMRMQFEAQERRISDIEDQLRHAKKLADWCACADEWGEEQDAALARYEAARRAEESRDG